MKPNRLLSDYLTSSTDLVFDIGMHTGQDTALYLRRGFSVVAIEANPTLVQENRKRFDRELKKSKLHIIEGVLVGDSSKVGHDNPVPFYLNSKSQWSTAVPERAEDYKHRGSDIEEVFVKQIRFEDILRDFGKPYYIKIDIEGSETDCLRTLSRIGVAPTYISIESDIKSYKALKQQILLLETIGYKTYQIVNQKDIGKKKQDTSYYEYGGSGDFGGWLPKDKWVSRKKVLRQYRILFLWYKLFSPDGILRNTFLFGTLTSLLSSITGSTIPSWHDVHACTMDSPS